jgi:hypothetical protein
LQDADLEISWDSLYSDCRKPEIDDGGGVGIVVGHFVGLLIFTSAPRDRV